MKAIYKQFRQLKVIQLTRHECLVLSVPESYDEESKATVDTVCDHFELGDMKPNASVSTNVQLTFTGKKSRPSPYTGYQDGSDYVLAWTKNGNEVKGLVVIEGYIYDFAVTWEEYDIAESVEK